MPDSKEKPRSLARKATPVETALERVSSSVLALQEEKDAMIVRIDELEARVQAHEAASLLQQKVGAKKSPTAALAGGGSAALIVVLIEVLRMFVA